MGSGGGYAVTLELGSRRRTHGEREWGLEIIWRVGAGPGGGSRGLEGPGPGYQLVLN